MIFKIIVELLQAIIWPVTVFIIVILLRSEISALLRRISRLKYKDVEAVFDKELREVERIVQAELRSSTPGPEFVGSNSSEADDRLQRLIEISPRAAIMEAWMEVESAIIDAARELGIGNERPAHHKSIIQEFHNKGLVDDGFLSIYDGLRRLRNEAVHVQDLVLPLSETGRYVDLSKSLTSYIRNEVIQLAKLNKNATGM